MVTELGETASWPASALDFVDDRIRRGKRAGDRDPEAERAFRTMFDGSVVRAYHLSRLLEHEADSIRTVGLRVATKNLFEERIKRATEVARFSDSFRDRLLALHALSDGDDDRRAYGRAGQVCFFVPLAYLKNDLFGPDSGMRGFLKYWGGEAVFTGFHESEREELTTFGRPSIVVATFDVATWLRLMDHISLLRLCVEIRTGIKTASSEILWRETVPPENIEAIWQPGDLNYDALENLPQA
jgi:hypothetical protein